MADLGKVVQHQRQQMVVTDTANPPDPPRGVRVADPAAEGVARIGRIGDDAASARIAGGLPDQPRLGIQRMDLEELGHGRRLGKAGRPSCGLPSYIIGIDSN